MKEQSGITVSITVRPPPSEEDRTRTPVSSGGVSCTNRKRDAISSAVRPASRRSRKSADALARSCRANSSSTSGRARASSESRVSTTRSIQRFEVAVFSIGSGAV